MEKHLKKAKTWNMVLLVLGLISVVIGIKDLPKTFSPKLSDYKLMGDVGQQMFDYMNSPLTKAITIVGLIVSIALLVMYFIANKNLADGVAPTKAPYYIYIGWNIINMVISLVTQPKMIVEGMDISFMTTVIGLVMQVIFMIPAILVIVHLFKAEPEE